jgi:hypothetical protein
MKGGNGIRCAGMSRQRSCGYSEYRVCSEVVETSREQARIFDNKQASTLKDEVRIRTEPIQGRLAI